MLLLQRVIIVIQGFNSRNLSCFLAPDTQLIHLPKFTQLRHKITVRIFQMQLHCNRIEEFLTLVSYSYACLLYQTILSTYRYKIKYSKSVQNYFHKCPQFVLDKHGNCVSAVRHFIFIHLPAISKTNTTHIAEKRVGKLNFNTSQLLYMYTC